MVTIMTEITIKLSDTPNNMYGKPLGLLNGMVKTVEYNKEVKVLLNAGVIEPTKGTTEPTKKTVEPIKETIEPVRKAFVSPRFKKKVVSRNYV